MKDFSFESNLCRDFLVVLCYKESSVLAEVLEKEQKESSLQKNLCLGGCNKFAYITQTQSQVESFEEVFHTETILSLSEGNKTSVAHRLCHGSYFLPLCLQQLPKVLSRPPSGKDLQQITGKDLAWCTVCACLFQHTEETEQLLDSVGCVDILDL